MTVSVHCILRPYCAQYLNMSKLAFVVTTMLVLRTQALVGAVNASAVSKINPATPFSDAGPVTTAMENLAYNTASITYEIAFQVNTKLERTASTLRGNMEVIVAAAMQQLTDPIFQANRKMGNAGCQPTWTMDELQRRIDLQLSNCTKELDEILTAFQAEADDIESNIRMYEKEIGNLPIMCQLLSNVDRVERGTMPTFSSGVSCFVEKMADINQLVGKELYRMGEALIRARKLSKDSTEMAQQCTEDMVDEVVTLLDISLQSC